MDESQKAQPFVRLLQERVDTWLASDEARWFQCAELYCYLPGLYVFLMRLATEPRVPQRERTGVLAALKYIIAPYDLIPEGVVGTSGFRDDLVLAAMTVEHVAEGADGVTPGYFCVGFELLYFLAVIAAEKIIPAGTWSRICPASFFALILMSVKPVFCNPAW